MTLQIGKDFPWIQWAGLSSTTSPWHHIRNQQQLQRQQQKHPQQPQRQLQQLLQQLMLTSIVKLTMVAVLIIATRSQLTASVLPVGR